MKIDKKIIKELSDYLEEFNLTELEYTEKDTKIKVSKNHVSINNQSISPTNKATSTTDLSETNNKTKSGIEVKSDIIEHLWKIIISDNTIDQYESNLMRRICGLIYFPDKMCAEIKLRLLNNK